MLGTVVLSHKGEAFRAEINGDNIRVSTHDKSNQVLFSRSPTSDRWQDETHRKVANAIQALEDAIADAAVEG